MATTSGRCRRAWSASGSTERWAPMATTSNRSGEPSTTSRAWVPIDPVDPTRLTVTAAPAGRAAPTRSPDRPVAGGGRSAPVIDPSMPLACPKIRRY